MQRGRRLTLTVMLCAVMADPVLAQSHETMHHHGVPSRLVADRRVGPYVASVWIEPEVGDGTVYVMLDAADGRLFIPPSAVRVALVPTSGRLPEMVHEAHPDAAGAHGGARYLTHVMFDRPERWNMRIIIEGSAGGGRLTLPVESTSNASMGPFGVILGAIPFVLVAFVYWRSWRARRRMIPALTTASRLTRPQLH